MSGYSVNIKQAPNLKRSGTFKAPDGQIYESPEAYFNPQGVALNMGGSRTPKKTGFTKIN